MREQRLRAVGGEPGRPRHGRGLGFKSPRAYHFYVKALSMNCPPSAVRNVPADFSDLADFWQTLEIRENLRIFDWAF